MHRYNCQALGLDSAATTAEETALRLLRTLSLLRFPARSVLGRTP
jgi:hypothetical protein